MASPEHAERGHDDDLHEIIEHVFLRDHVWALRVALVLWVAAGALFVIMAVPPWRNGVQSLDQMVYDLTYPVKWEPVTVMAKALAFVGSAVFLWPVRIVVTGFLALKRRWPALWVWIGAILVSEPMIGILKNAYGRARPSVALVTVTSPAFPSGHAVAGSVVAVSLVIVFVRAGPARRNLELLAAGFSILMAGSRVYLGAHWLTDVVAGVAFGSACALGVAAVVQRTLGSASSDVPTT